MAALLPSRLYCTPAIIYLVISAITILSAVGTVSVFMILLKIIFVLLWAWFLNFLCDSGYSSVSWFLVFLPIIFTILMIVISFEVIDLVSKNNTNVTMQPERV
jgi:hypothetical protein